MFKKIKDVFQVRNIERSIRRSLTIEELNQIDEGESLILETPSGGFMIRHVDTYDIRDLVNEEIDWHRIEKWDQDENAGKIKKDAKESPKVFKSSTDPTEAVHNKSRNSFLKLHGFDDIEDAHGNIQRQVFQTPKLEQAKYFYQLEQALHEIASLKQPFFEDPTDAFIINLHCFDGLSDVEISRRLLTKQDTALKPLGQKAVSCRRLKVLRKLEIEPYTFRK